MPSKAGSGAVLDIVAYSHCVPEIVLVTLAAAGRQAVIQVVQLFDDRVYAGKHGRTPTLDEIRSMSWQAIVAGASGLAPAARPGIVGC